MARRRPARVAAVLAVWILAAPIVPAFAQAPGDAETVAELKAALAELRRRLAEQTRPATDAELQVARRQIERLTEAMIGLKRERDTLRGEVVALRSDRERLQASEAEQRRRATASEAKVARLERELEGTATAQRPPTLATAEPVRRSETLAGSAFAPGAATLREDALLQLGVIAAWLRAQPDGTVVIEGHTDASGDAEANRRLSLARAEAVRDGLVALGLPPDRLEVLGRGEQLPVADNATEEGRATNRRVVVTLER